jgi:hypothetical protein
MASNNATDGSASAGSKKVSTSSGEGLTPNVAVVGIPAVLFGRSADMMFPIRHVLCAKCCMSVATELLERLSTRQTNLISAWLQSFLRDWKLLMNKAKIVPSDGSGPPRDYQPCLRFDASAARLELPYPLFIK